MHLEQVTDGWSVPFLCCYMGLAAWDVVILLWALLELLAVPAGRERLFQPFVEWISGARQWHYGAVRVCYRQALTRVAVAFWDPKRSRWFDFQLSGKSIITASSLNRDTQCLQSLDSALTFTSQWIPFSFVSHKALSNQFHSVLLIGNNWKYTFWKLKSINISCECEDFFPDYNIILFCIMLC